MKRIIKQLNEYSTAMDEQDLPSLLFLLLENLGTPDIELREEIMECLSAFFGTGKCPDNLHSKIIEKLISKDQLFYRFDEKGDLFAIKRSYSCLAIKLILYSNIKGSSFLNKKTISNLAENLFNYWEGEKNLTGKSKRIGWIHCHAHLADALAMLFYHPNIDILTLKHSLSRTLKICLKRESIFANGEEMRIGRICSIVLKIINPQDSLKIFQNYNIEELLDKGTYPQNLRLIMMSIYIYINNDTEQNMKKNKELSSFLLDFISFC